jgi:hypothetical protein
VKSISLGNLKKLSKILVDGEDGKDGTLKIWYHEVLSDKDDFFQIKDGAGVVQSYRDKEPNLRTEHVTSHLVAAYLKSNKYEHPAKKHPHLFSRSRAKAVVTYQWKQPLGGENGLHQMIIDAGVSPDTTIWVDVWFNDQNSKQIVLELAISQEYYMLCDQHLIATSGDFKRDVLDRAWCLWEVGLRSHAGKKSQIMGKLVLKVILRSKLKTVRKNDF